jgi:hypothetical protein
MAHKLAVPFDRPPARLLFASPRRTSRQPSLDPLRNGNFIGFNVRTGIALAN